MNKIKTAVGVLALTMCAGAGLAGTITWGDLGAGGTFQDAGGTPLQAVGTGGDYLIELVYIGDAGAIYEPTDTVVDSGQIGEGTFFNMTDGGFVTSYTFDSGSSPYTSGVSQFVIVFYDAGSAGAATFYGVSAAFTLGQDLGDPTASENFTQSSPLQAATPIPEPGTVMLALCGIGALVARRRSRK